ncbi:MAG: LPS translocon maturation chaperone LptM [Endozoicomonas sp.]
MPIITARKKAALVFSAFLITGLLTGCGQKGDLYQPKQQTAFSHSVQP